MVEANPLNSRERVLSDIRAALSDVSDASAPVRRDYARSHAGEDITGLFASRVTDYQATVVRTVLAELPGAIAQALEGRRVIVPPGFPPEWLPDGDWPADEPPLTVAELDAADGVISTAAVAIAVTGTIVLDAGPGQGRRVLTLLPDYHLCVVRAGQIAGDVPEALERLDPVAPLTFISGPSATSDIELDRVEGVHGPRTLHVIIVNDL